MGGHEHGHNHAHGGHCGCGHEHSAGRGGDSCAQESGGIRVELRRHEEAVVVSGALTVFGEYAVARAVLEKELAAVGRAVTASGGIIGHIKASAEITETQMYSLTREEVSVKTSPEQRIALRVAAIVFAVPEETARQLVLAALEAVQAKM